MTTTTVQNRFRIYLEHLRREQKLTTGQLGKILECSQSAAAMKLRGDRAFTLDEAVRAARHFGFSVDDLGADEGPLVWALDETLARKSALDEASDAVLGLLTADTSSRCIGPWAGRRACRRHRTARPATARHLRLVAA